MNAFAHYPIIIASREPFVNPIFIRIAGFFEKVAKFLRLRLDKRKSGVYNAIRKDKGVLNRVVRGAIFIVGRSYLYG